MSGAPRLGVARIRPQSDGRYLPDPDGERAIIMSVHDRHDRLADLVAWFHHRPNCWWLRRGTETPILGAHNLAIAAFFGDVITLEPNPDAWAFNGASGACVLCWNMDLRDLFDGVAAVRCKTPALRARFQAALRQREPKLTVSQVEVDYAA